MLFFILTIVFEKIYYPMQAACKHAASTPGALSLSSGILSLGSRVAYAATPVAVTIAVQELDAIPSRYWRPFSSLFITCTGSDLIAA